MSIVIDNSSWLRFINIVGKAKLIAYDTETTGLRPFHGDHIVGMAFGADVDNEFHTFYVPLLHTGFNLATNCRDKLCSLMEDPNKIWLCWNAKFDMHMTRQEYGVQGTVLDAMLAMHLCNENEFEYGLKTIANKYFGSESVRDEADLLRLLAERKLTKGNLGQLTAEEVAPYAESDVRLTHRIFKSCMSVLKLDGLYDIFREVCEYSEVVAACERCGVLIDVDHCATTVPFALSKCKELNDMLDRLCGRHVNPNSSPQMQNLFRRASVTKEILEELSHRDDDTGKMARLVYEFRGWGGAVSKFLRVFMDSVDSKNYLHANFNLHRVISGRLSCSGPNLQALSRVDEEKPWTPVVRRAVIAPPGHVLLSADYSQAELRLLAHYTQDKLLMDAYADPNNQKDIHQLVSEMIGIERYYAKRINFGIVYGMGVKEGIIQLKRPENEVRDILNRYHRLLPGIKKLYSFMEATAKKNGYIKMWTGRRRRYHLPYGHHKAMSNLIQGGVAEIMRLSMVKLRPALPSHSFMVLQVHDDIIIQTPEDRVMEVAAIQRNVMQDFNFRVPMLVDQKCGSSWGTMVSLDKWKP